jgi:Tetracyclin repressor-like, C-terminal domain
LIEASITKKWKSGRRHTERMTEILEQIIASGMSSGEFSQGDAEAWPMRWSQRPRDPWWGLNPFEPAPN